MKLTLKNFRCYVDSTFDLGSDGVSLLSGPSGIGKTTILLAIQFALFGTGNKLVSLGKTSCSVKLEFDEIIIVRTKRPNRLVVNEIYEDDAGQEIINKKFGETFSVSGYISQNALNSFILMSPLDKLDFLEKFAFRDVNLNKIKAKSKALIAECSEKLTSVNSKIDLTREMISEIEIPPKVNFPLKSSVKGRDIAIKNQEIKLKNCNIKISKAETKLKNLKTELEKLKLLKAFSSSRKELLTKIEDRLNLKLSEQKEKFINVDEALKNIKFLNENLKFLSDNEKLIKMELTFKEDSEKIEKMKNIENLNVQEKINDIRSKLLKSDKLESLVEDVEFLEEEIKDLTLCKKLSESLSRLKTSFSKEEFEKIRNEIKEKTEKLEKLKIKLSGYCNVYECPNCFKLLNLIDDKLSFSSEIINGEELKRDIESLKSELELLKLEFQKQTQTMNEISRIEKQIVEIKEQYEEFIISDIDSKTLELKKIRELLFENKNLQKVLQSLLKDLNSSSSAIKNFQDAINKLETEINSKKSLLVENSEFTRDRESISLKIEKLKREISIFENSKLEITNLEKEKVECESFLTIENEKYLKTFKTIREEKEIDEQISEMQKELSILSTDLNLLQNNSKLLEKWKIYNSIIENKEKLESRLDSLLLEEKEERDKYSGATMLKEKILEAESVAMVHVINSINVHAQVYLEYFFPDNPISVQLSPFKEVKNTSKPKINVEVDYKGMETDLTCLSGGELSRVILAYTLALAEMFNTPLLLLDECTSSLDQELTSTVFEGIREHFKGKLTLIIAHQVITGNFDKEIKLL